MKIIACLLLSFALVSYAVACDCVYGGPFIKVAHKTDLVALVKIKRYLNFIKVENRQVPTLMEVEIIEKYKGLEVKTTVRVWGDNGFMCRPYLDTFTTGKKFVMALKSCGDIAVQSGEMPEDYFIDACGGYWLMPDEKRGLVRGDFDGKGKQALWKTVNRFLVRTL